VNSGERLIRWNSNAYGSGWTGVPYPGLGVAGDATSWYPSGSVTASMLQPTGARLRFSAYLFSMSSEIITINVTGRMARPPPSVSIAPVPAAVLPAVTVTLPYAIWGFSDQFYELQLIAAPLFGSDAVGTFYVLGSRTASVSNGNFDSLTFSFSTSTPIGPYLLHLGVLDMDEGSARVVQNIGTIYRLNASNPVIPATRSALPSKTRSEITYSSFFVLKKMRVRKIFQFSYLIPIILINQ
jgi:hypothetical protein